MLKGINCSYVFSEKGIFFFKVEDMVDMGFGIAGAVNLRDYRHRPSLRF